MIKRILCILYSLDRGGAETFMMKLYRSFDRNQYQIDFVVNTDGVYDKEVLSLGGKIYKIPLRTEHPFKSFSCLKKIVYNNKYIHVIKLGDSPLSVIDLIAAKQGGAKVLAMRSCNALVNLSKKQQLIDCFFQPVLNKVANVKVAPSDLAACYTFGEEMYKSGNVQILNNAVDLAIYHYDVSARERIRSEFNISDKLVVGHVGRFAHQKNHQFLIEIYERIYNKNSNSVLLLVGDGVLLEETKKYAEKMKIIDNVIFAGVRDDIPAILSAMDVFVFPSFHEGMPNTVIEAQATGLPCVISDSITKTANITGLVQYLSLDMSSDEWAKKVLEIENVDRKDVKDDFVNSGYEIQSTRDVFLRLMFKS